MPKQEQKGQNRGPQYKVDRRMPGEEKAFIEGIQTGTPREATPEEKTNYANNVRKYMDHFGLKRYGHGYNPELAETIGQTLHQQLGDLVFVEGSIQKWIDYRERNKDTK